MNPDWQEGDWEFDFSGARHIEKEPSYTTGKGKKTHLPTVDFVAHYSDETWFIECKNPEGTPKTYKEGAVKATLSALDNDALLTEHLLPKIFGTYADHALKNCVVTNRARYGVVIGVSDLDAALRLTVTDKLQGVLDAIGPCNRQTQEAPIAEVHNVASWNEKHPDIALTKL